MDNSRKQKNTTIVILLIIIIVLLLLFGGYFLLLNRNNSDVSTTNVSITIKTTNKTITTTQMTTTTTGIKVIDITSDILGDSFESWNGKLLGLVASTDNVYEGDARYENKLISIETYKGNIISTYVNFGKKTNLGYKISVYGFDENATRKEVAKKFAEKVVYNDKVGSSKTETVVAVSMGVKYLSFNFKNEKLQSVNIIYDDSF